MEFTENLSTASVTEACSCCARIVSLLQFDFIRIDLNFETINFNVEL